MVNLQFVVVAVVLAIVVLALVLYPLLQRQWKVGAALLALCLAGTGLLYAQIGTPDALDARLLREPTSIQDAIVQLEHALARDPAQVEGWALLAQSYRQVREPVKSREAYARAVALAPDEPGLLADAAEARAFADPNRLFDEQARQWLAHALQVQPGHERAAWFMGVAQRQQGRNAEAAATWTPLLTRVSPTAAEALLPQINEARAAAGLAPMAMPARATASANALIVRVQLPDALLKDPRFGKDAQVFVIARVPGGPPMPVAVEKHPLHAVPAEITLDDGDSPMPSARLSSLKAVEVLVRVSTKGVATRSEDDIESAPVTLALPASAPVTLQVPAP